ncbi:MAG TPA: carboxypeptidase regulatory-like domain-containing protein [Vicinamibacterales bacterium]|nr:carboxypeptidase regulatory-like domain-containing protein [Vicinamibacterales bacterium]
MRKFSLLLLVCLAWAAPAWAQSQAANGAIEGTISDSSGGVLPGVTVTITNTDTGTERTVVTNEKGLYRAPLLPLGTYRVIAELQGFKKFEQTNVKLSVGETATVNATLAVGAVSETITVSGADVPALESARIDIGHTMTDVEVHNLPLVARNPYNFALVQPGVTGIENVEFGVPRLAANGAAMRINYQIDGNTNTEKDRAGLRLLPMSEVMIQEVKVVTTGFAPEFGQTMGMVYNAVTPSGTNTFKGEGSYLFRRKPFSAFPFFFGCGSTTVAANCPPITADATQKPDTRTDSGTADIGGPIMKNKAFFYAGWEQTRRDLSSGSLITVDPSIVSQVGLKPQPTAVPNVQTAKFAIGKGDFQLNGNNRLTARWIRFHNDAPGNSGGGTATIEQSTDFLDAMDSTGGQLVSSLGSNMLNEARMQYAHRHQSSVANSDSGTGPAVRINSPSITFGAPLSGTGQGSAGFDFKQNMTQVIDNFTYIRAAHSYKFGIDYQHIYDERTQAPQFLYTFPTIASYLAAKSGTNPFGYSTLTQLAGNLGFNMSTNVVSAFVQDDWQIAPSVKVLYGVRYDVYLYPEGLSDAPLASSRAFNIDKNNFGPRLGVAWAADAKTVVRASTGIMYDQPILGGYEQAYGQSAAPSRSAPYSFSGTTPGAPAFPNAASTGTAVLPNAVWTVDPNFVVAHTWQSNVQVERAVGRDFTMFAGLMYARGSDLPVVTNINPINPVSFLADGRPVFSTTVSAATRLDPRFNSIQEVQSIGSSTFKGLTVGTNKRLGNGLSWNLQYSLAKGLDNTPLLTQLTVQAETGRSDPTNLDRDLGPNPLDIRHSLNGNIVYITHNSSSNRVVHALADGNEIGILIQINSGLPINVLSNQDLNKDGVSSDRPAFVARNPLYLAARKNVDLRYTRWIPISGSVRGEFIVELKNVFNTEQLAGVTTTTVTDALGNPTNPTTVYDDPYQYVNPSGYEQRKLQLGLKVRF